MNDNEPQGPVNKQAQRPRDYDTAVFEQAIRRKVRFGMVTHTDIAEAFWISAADHRAWLLANKPDAMPEAERIVREQLVPGLVPVVWKLGVRVMHMERKAARP